MVNVNGVEVPVTLSDDTVAVIAAAIPMPQQTTWPEWMDAFKAADYLGVSVERVRKLKDRGAIPAYQEAPRCRVLFRRRDLDASMEALRINTRGGDA
jgi:excisionase family DNA binding protein